MGSRPENQVPHYRPLTFACPHMQISNVVAASCGVCGPLTPRPEVPYGNHVVQF